jgi:hypothetical protein
MRHRLLALLLLLGLPLLAVGVATPASAQTAPSVEVSSATVVARGAALDLTATVTCGAGYIGYLSINVTERSGSGIAQGYGSTSFVCTGEPQTVTVSLIAQGSGAPFRVGTAVLNASISACSPDYSTCQYFTVANQEFRIRP